MEVYMFEGPINCTVPMPDGFQAGRPLFLSSVLVQVFPFRRNAFFLYPVYEQHESRSFFFGRRVRVRAPIEHVGHYNNAAAKRRDKNQN